jgi:hypothetical protein
MRQQLTPLGLQDVRLAAVQRLSHDFLAEVRWGGAVCWAGSAGRGGVLGLACEQRGPVQRALGWQGPSCSRACRGPAADGGAAGNCRNGCLAALHVAEGCRGLPAGAASSGPPAQPRARAPTTNPSCRTGGIRPSSTAAAASPQTPGASSAGARPAPGVRRAPGSRRRVLPACVQCGGRRGQRGGSGAASPGRPACALAAAGPGSAAGAPSPPCAGVQDAALKSYLSWASGKKVAAGRGEGKAKRKAPAAAGSAAGGLRLAWVGSQPGHAGIAAQLLSCASAAGPAGAKRQRVEEKRQGQGSSGRGAGDTRRSSRLQGGGAAVVAGRRATRAAAAAGRAAAGGV